MYAIDCGGSKLLSGLPSPRLDPSSHLILYPHVQYRIGQLYMIARHSAEESKGGGDGVEVVVNESCHDDVHGDGQYTEKRIYLTRWVGNGF